MALEKKRKKKKEMWCVPVVRRFTTQRQDPRVRSCKSRRTTQTDRQQRFSQGTLSLAAWSPHCGQQRAFARRCTWYVTLPNQGLTNDLPHADENERRRRRRRRKIISKEANKVSSRRQTIYALGKCARMPTPLPELQSTGH